MSDRQVVVFDLDGTLVHGDSFTHFCIHLAKATPARALGLALLAPVLGLFALTPKGRVRVTMLTIWSLTVGLSEDDLTRHRAAFAARRFFGPRPRTMKEALAALASHERKGDLVVVVTGCEQALASQILACLGQSKAEPRLVLGSRLERRHGGQVPAFHCFGPAKLVALQEAGFHPPYARVYTDSPADLPLLRAATQAYLVRPSARNRARIARELPNVIVLSPEESPDPFPNRPSPKVG